MGSRRLHAGATTVRSARRPSTKINEKFATPKRNENQSICFCRGLFRKATLDEVSDISFVEVVTILAIS